MPRFSRSIYAALTLIAGLFSASSAFAQGACLQGGPWGPGHFPQYVGQGSSQCVLQDGGDSGGGGPGANPSELGVTARGVGAAPYAGQGKGPWGTNICDYDAPINNAAGYHYVCLSANAQGAGLIAFGSGGAATPLGAKVIIDGVTYNLANLGNIAVASVCASDLYNVLCYGAKGDSNGSTPGSGQDNTAIFQEVLNLSILHAGSFSGRMHIPCGIYRVTGTITGADPTSTYTIQGDGGCTHIFLDNSSPGTVLWQFNGFCGGAAPCLVFDGVTMTRPTTPSGTIAIFLNKWEGAVIRNSIIFQYGTGIKIVNAFGPHIYDNDFSAMQGAAIDCSYDNSCNSVRIEHNYIFSNGFISSLAAILIGPTTGSDCASVPSVISIFQNNLEGNFGSVTVNGACSLDFNGNYMETSGFGLQINTLGWHKAFNVANNWIFTTPMTINNVAGIVLTGNTFWNTTVTIGSGVTGLVWGPANLADGTSAIASLCTAIVRCSYLNNGSLIQWGSVTTVSGVATVTLPLACPTTSGYALLTSAGGDPTKGVAVTALGQTSFGVASALTTDTVMWNYLCQ